MRIRDRNSLAEQLAAARQRIAELEATLARLEHRDPVTGTLLSLRSFRAQLELDVARADRYGRPLSVALLDVDRFRQLNLQHGDAAGDSVLAALGRQISERTRMNDLACRTGGDEFAILFVETGRRRSRRSSASSSSSRTLRSGPCAGSRSRSGSLGSPRGSVRRHCSRPLPRRSRRPGRPVGARRSCSSRPSETGLPIWPISAREA